MLDPGTSLAVLTLATEAAKGLLAYYELWGDADHDVRDIQTSILWLAKVFTQLAITLQRENLQEDIVSVIRLTVTGCEGNILKLKAILDKIRHDGSPKELQKFRTVNRKLLYMFHSHAIKKLTQVLSDLKGDLKLAINLLNL